MKIWRREKLRIAASNTGLLYSLRTQRNVGLIIATARAKSLKVAWSLASEATLNNIGG
jgi:hypothetical protein